MRVFKHSDYILIGIEDIKGIILLIHALPKSLISQNMATIGNCSKSQECRHLERREGSSNAIFGDLLSRSG